MTHTHVCVYMYNCLNIIIEHVSSNKSQQIILLYVIFDTLGNKNTEWLVCDIGYGTPLDLVFIAEGKLCPNG